MKQSAKNKRFNFNIFLNTITDIQQYYTKR